LLFQWSPCFNGSAHDERWSNELEDLEMREYPLLTLLILVAAISGCSSVAVIENRPGPNSQEAYSIRSYPARETGTHDIGMILALSGGGSRAAALSLGVLEALRDTTVEYQGRQHRLLDEVDVISSVSGGSFTAAYYGLYGDRIFEDFADVFLHQDIEGRLIQGLLNPLQWFSSTGRTDMAVRLYEKQVFHGATFDDMNKAGGPLVLINASDLGMGVRFSFVQEYFNLLCSDISSFPVARAVTASSAVPVLFNPVVLENYGGCKGDSFDWFARMKKRAREQDPELRQILEGLESYADKEGRRYIHFVDGGITDNLGLRALYELVEVSGGARAFVSRLGTRPPRQLVLMVVNAATYRKTAMDQSKEPPSLGEVLDAVTDVQLHRYNTATLQTVHDAVRRWANALSTPEQQVTPHMVIVSLKRITDPSAAQFFNAIPTSFVLTDEQVDALIAAGYNLLLENPQYQSLVRELNGRLPEPRPLKIKPPERREDPSRDYLDI